MAAKPFNIIFNDQCLMIVEKIAQLLIQPSPRGEKVTLTSLLAKETGQKVFPCHRLDRQTSGLIIYAKSLPFQQRMMEEFRRGRVEKKYLAFVKGCPKKREGLLKDYIIDREGKILGEAAKPAKTAYKVLKVFPGWSMVELKPLTGRTNQLRIQLAKLGNPILGERKYAFGRDFKVKFRRLALHAFYLSFIHPVAKERLTSQIKLAQDMETFLNFK